MTLVVERLRPDGHPVRACTGDPEAVDFAFCGRDATVVARSSYGERFACSEHIGLAHSTPIDVWWTAFDAYQAREEERRQADEAVARMARLDEMERGR